MVYTKKISALRVNITSAATSTSQVSVTETWLCRIVTKRLGAEHLYGTVKNNKNIQLVTLHKMYCFIMYFLAYNLYTIYH